MLSHAFTHSCKEQYSCVEGSQSAEPSPNPSPVPLFALPARNQTPFTYGWWSRLPACLWLDMWLVVDPACLPACLPACGNPACLWLDMWLVVDPACLPMAASFSCHRGASATTAPLPTAPALPAGRCMAQVPHHPSRCMVPQVCILARPIDPLQRAASLCCDVEPPLIGINAQVLLKHTADGSCSPGEPICTAAAAAGYETACRLPRSAVPSPQPQPLLHTLSQPVLAMRHRSPLATSWPLPAGCIPTLGRGNRPQLTHCHASGALTCLTCPCSRRGQPHQQIPTHQYDTRLHPYLHGVLTLNLTPKP
jgi:hypothetical protein